MMTDQMKLNILEYANRIQTIEKFVNAVRQNPGQYIGYLGNEGFINMIREIFQNAIDELEKEDSPCTKIIVSFDERDHTVMVEDNGRGIPFGEIVRVYTQEHTSSNYSKKKGEYSSGLHGVGGKVTNALSSEFIVKSYILGKGKEVRFINGNPWDKGTKGEVDIKNPGKQGTVVEFRPAYEIMGTITVGINDVLSLINRILILTKIGSQVEFRGITKDGKPVQMNLVNQHGIISDLMNKSKNPLIKPIILHNDTGEMKADIAFTFDATSLETEITSYANFCPTLEGEHLKGFISGVCNFFRKYMNNVFLANNNKITIENSDIKQGLKAILHVAHIKPVFSGQAKEILANPEMNGFVKELITTSLEEWLKANPNDVKKLCTLFKDNATLRVKSDKDRINITKKYTSSALSAGMPAKFIKPNEKEHLELIIVEGDSARGSLENSRDKRCQGLFPIRGKVPNAFNTPREKFLNNEEIAAMITIIGAGFGRNCDPSKSKWEKIIIGTDADPDGAHIRVLLLKFFLLYMPEIIEAGMVYSSVPPLYGIKLSNGKNPKIQYFTEKIDYVRYVQSTFTKNNDLRDQNGMKLSKSETTSILYNNMDYIVDLENTAGTFAINPYLLEFILINLLPLDKLNFTKFKKVIESNNRFLKVGRNKSTITIHGEYDERIHDVFINDKFIKECGILIRHLTTTPAYYVLNGEKVSLYKMMQIFEASSPKSLLRYKGLGEMNPNELAESTFDPAGNRTLWKYTIEGIKESLETMRILNTDTASLLEDIQLKKEDL